MGADLDAQPAADTALLDDRPVLIPHLEADRLIAERTDADAGAADPPVDPGITGGFIDFRDPHIDLVPRNDGERGSSLPEAWALRDHIDG